jgi:hypothetical protein
MILEVTVSTNHGYCGRCIRTRGARYCFKQAGALLSLAGGLVVIPFAVLWFGIRGAWRRWRFPFDRSTLLGAIRAVHSENSVAQAYFEGVVEGYWDSSAESQLWTRHPPSRFGSLDGGRLRRGEIVIFDIPTYRGRMTVLTKMPYIRYRKVGGSGSS